ncbi:hypothetical protein GDO86_005847 [Hymenochirus boettgeri]|uniref:V-type proton ATPase subunit S1 n=1 Tax=Hymenochirus boettgeri TaxID=247094 RepID=A0A8T2JB58_9PIPI|nr:hypothetical protein GDO86_005847 [Hymenochirus boettgeri]
MKPVYFSLVCVIWAFPPAVTSVSHVPVLLWSTQRSAWEIQPLASAGHIILKDELYKLLNPTSTERKNIVLFLQDTLSIDDFTYYSTANGSENSLYNVQELLKSSASSLVLPAVEWKAINDLPDYLTKQGDWNIITIENISMSSSLLDSNKPNLIIIQLQSIPRSSKTAAAKAFSGNDKQIGRITKELVKSHIGFMSVYTGMKQLKVSKAFDVMPKLGRRLLTTDSPVQYPPLNVTNGTDSTCILIYATQILITANKSLIFDLTNMTFQSSNVDTSLSTCFESNSTLSLFYSSPGHGIGSLELRFFMTNQFYTGSARNWFKLESIQIIPNGDIAKNASFNTSYASAPAEYSFHCHQVGTSSIYGENLIRNSNEANNWDIFISDFQIQGFSINNNLFSYASDCTSFFTPAIWMGLVSSIVLLWILSYGIFMIMQLTTNDKFDDPKGQTLSVPQTE